MSKGPKNKNVGKGRGKAWEDANEHSTLGRERVECSGRTGAERTAGGGPRRAARTRADIIPQVRGIAAGFACGVRHENQAVDRCR